MKQFFITGTDTDCGKTFVTCELLKQLKQQGQTAFALKPVASGCLERDGLLVSEDVLRIEPYQHNNEYAICRWAFKPPVSPHIAAAQAGMTITAEAVADFCNPARFQPCDTLLIEGAGGLMVPLNPEQTWLDFLKLSRIPVIVVVGLRLGCLNHALLTARVLQHYEIPCQGWIANCLSKDMLFSDENIALLQQQMGMPHLATVAYGGGFSGGKLSL